MQDENELLLQSKLLYLEAQRLLERGLLTTLESSSPTFVHGSYNLDLLSRRDLDINLRLSNDHDIETFFQVGAAITRSHPVHKASFSNHFTRGFPSFDYGLYWGIELSFEEHRWKLDVWGLVPEKFVGYQRQFEALKDSLEQHDKLTLLTLKNQLQLDKGYKNGVTSVDIYNAVMAGVTTIDEFERWRNNGLHVR